MAKDTGELKPGDEIIVEGMRITFTVASVGEKTVKAMPQGVPVTISIPKDKIIWRTPLKTDVAVRRLRGISGYEPGVILRKRKLLSEMT